MAYQDTPASREGSTINNPNDSADYHNESRKGALNQLRKADTVTMSPELFEKLYLTPQTPVSGGLRQMFGNPTPMYVTYHTRLGSKSLRAVQLTGTTVHLLVSSLV